mgnify:CR=1 FL=1
MAAVTLPKTRPSRSEVEAWSHGTMQPLLLDDDSVADALLAQGRSIVDFELIFKSVQVRSGGSLAGNTQRQINSPAAMPAPDPLADRPYASEIGNAARAASLDPALVHAVIFGLFISIMSSNAEGSFAPLFGILLIVLNLILHFVLPSGDFFVTSNLFLHLGIILAIFGFMLAWAL